MSSRHAMTDYATLLGMPGAVAKSVPMTVIRDGTTVEWQKSK